MENFFITTTLPYINSEPHLGFAKEIINADIIARYKRQLGFNVFFNTGTDEHGKKIYQKALEANMEISKYCDKYSKKFLELKEVLNLSFDNFIRTTDEDHIKAVQNFWERCRANGDIYKKKYSVKYCVGCEMEKTDSELENGVCPFHPNQEIENIDEENYFFKFSKYQNQLLDFYKKNPDFVQSSGRFKEIISFVQSGLKDFSVSRLKEKMPWGVPVPEDDTQVMYVWFDALVNYISCLGWPDNLENFDLFWPGLQVCGKDNLRPQTAMWPAFLMSAGITPPQKVLVFGFLTVNNQKISKSLGNSVDLFQLIKKYGSDVIRYYLSKEISTFEDGDFSYEKLEKLYLSDLSNGLGNLVARVSNLIEKNNLDIKLRKPEFQGSTPMIPKEENSFFNELDKKMKEYKLNEALNLIALKTKKTDEFLSHKAPWKMTDKKEMTEVLQIASADILDIALSIFPFIPETADKIIKQFTAKEIVKGESLFPKLIN
ncbi:MAG: methionine--tRNA ligase [Patescibacteria group bacterium]|jgi:methionyl-tRNA synthetase